MNYTVLKAKLKDIRALERHRAEVVSPVLREHLYKMIVQEKREYRLATHQGFDKYETNYRTYKVDHETFHHFGTIYAKSIEEALETVRFEYVSEFNIRCGYEGWYTNRYKIAYRRPGEYAFFIEEKYNH